MRRGQSANGYHLLHYIIYEYGRKRKIFGEGVEEKPPCSPLRGLIQTLSVKNQSLRLMPEALIFYSSISRPSTVTVTTCHGMNFPLCWSAFFAASSSPPQQGTSIRTTVTLLMSLLRMISVSFSA